MSRKTNLMRLLESRGIPYETHEFSTDIRSAEDAAKVLGVPPCHVFKTLVVTRQRGCPLLVLIPGDRVLDLKRLARSIREKRLRMATHKEAETLTGLEVGGISALRLVHKGFVVYADEAILSLPRVYVSAGHRGINLSLHPEDLLRVANARTVQATRAQESEPTV